MVQLPGRGGKARSEKRAGKSAATRAQACEEEGPGAEPPELAKETDASQDEYARGGGEEHDWTEEHHSEEGRTDEGPEPACGSEETRVDAGSPKGRKRAQFERKELKPTKKRAAETPSHRKRARKDERRESDSEDRSGSPKTRGGLSDPTVGEPYSEDEQDRATSSKRLAKTGARREKYAYGPVSSGSSDDLCESPRRGKRSSAPDPQVGTLSRGVGRRSTRGRSATDSDSDREPARPGNRGPVDERALPASERRDRRGECQDERFPPGRSGRSHGLPRDGNGSSSAEDREAGYEKYKAASVRCARSKERKKAKHRRLGRERSPGLVIKRRAGTTPGGLKGRSEQKEKDTLSKRSNDSAGEEYVRGDLEEEREPWESGAEGARSEPSSESSGKEDGGEASETCRGSAERGRPEQAIQCSQKGARGDSERAGPSGVSCAEKAHWQSGYAPGPTSVESSCTGSGTEIIM